MKKIEQQKIHVIGAGGRFHKSWAQGANQRDRSIHLHPMPMPYFLRSFLQTQKFGARA